MKRLNSSKKVTVEVKNVKRLIKLKNSFIQSLGIREVFMIKSKLLKKGIVTGLTLALFFQYTPLNVYAQSDVEVKRNENQVIIENEYISREFMIQENHLTTASIVTQNSNVLYCHHQTAHFSLPDFHLCFSLVSDQACSATPNIRSLPVERLLYNL